MYRRFSDQQYTTVHELVRRASPLLMKDENAVIWKIGLLIDLHRHLHYRRDQLVFQKSALNVQKRLVLFICIVEVARIINGLLALEI